MLKRYFTFTKAVAVITLACFLISNGLGQGFASLASGTPGTAGAARIRDGFVLPATLGKITDARYFGSRKVVIAIQDLHCHPEVQKNIGRIIGLLDENPGIERVYLEGAAGAVDTSWLGAVADRELRQDVVEALLAKGAMTGAESYSVLSGRYRLIAGLEDAALYTENVRRLGGMLERRPQIDAALGDLKADVAPLAGAYYGEGNRRFEKLLRNYQTGEAGSGKYYLFLKKYSDKLGIDIGSYRNLSTYVQLSETGGRINYRRVAGQLQEVIGVLRQRLPYGAYELLRKSTADFSLWDELPVYLARIETDYPAGMNISRDYPQLGKFIAYVQKSRKLNPVALVREEQKLVRDIQLRLAASKSERDIVFLTNFTRYLDDYLGNRISAEECGYFEENFARFKVLYGKYGDASRLNALLPYVATMQDFYRVNRERNDVFFDAMPLAGSSGRPVPAGTDDEERVLAELGRTAEGVVAVMGGFHTEGFTRLLQDQKISYLVITPGVTGQADLAEQRYTRAIRQQASMAAQTLAVQALSQNPGDLKALKTVSAFIGSRLDERVPQRTIEDEMNLVLRYLAENDPAGKRTPVMFRLREVEKTRTGYRFSFTVTTGDGEREYTADSGPAGDERDETPAPGPENGDADFMRMALEQARESGRTRGFFSAKVGAVVVIRAADGKEVVGKGFNDHGYELHAEQFALVDALRRLLDDIGDAAVRASLAERLTQVLDRSRPENYEKSGSTRAEFFAATGAELDDIAREIGMRTGRTENVLRGARLYVTLEPCRKCAAMFAGFQVGRIVFGAHSTNEGNNGSKLLGDIPCTGGVLEKESRRLNRGYHFFSSGKIRPRIYSSFQFFMRHKSVQKKVMGIAVAMTTGLIAVSTAFGYYDHDAPSSSVVQGGIGENRLVVMIIGAAGILFLIKGILTFVMHRRGPEQEIDDAADGGRKDTTKQLPRLLRKTFTFALSGGSGVAARLAARLTGKPVSAVPAELENKIILRYYRQLNDIPLKEAAALNGMKSIACMYVLPEIPDTGDDTDFVPIGPEIEVWRDGQRRFVPVYAGVYRDAQDNPVRVFGVPGLQPGETAAVMRWLNDAPQIHEHVRQRLDLPDALVTPEAGPVPYVLEINGVGIDDLPQLRSLDDGSLYNAAVVLCGPGLNEEAAADRGRGVIGTVNGRSLPPSGQVAQRLQALMKNWRSAMMRKSAAAVMRGASAMRENVPVSALRGENDEQDPGIGKLPDIPLYYARTLKPKDVGMQLLPFTDPAAGEARAGDPALVSLTEVEEMKRLVSAGIVARGAVYASDAQKDAVNRTDVLQREYAVLSKAYALLVEDRSSPRFKAFEDYARKEASWLDGYARGAAARMNKESDPAAIGTAKYVQWLFDGQIAAAIDAVHRNGGEVSFRLDIGSDDYGTNREAIARWFACGFDGVRVRFRDAGSIGQEEIRGIQEAVAAAKPDAFVIWQLPEGAAVPESLAGSLIVKPYREAAAEKSISGDVIVEMDPQKRLQGAEVTEALERCKGSAGILMNIGDLEGDSMPAEDFGSYRLPRDGDVDRYRSFDGASRWLEDIVGFVRTNLPQSPRAFYRYGYEVMGLNLFKGVAPREDEMGSFRRVGVYRYLDPGEVRPETFGRIGALLKELEARGGVNEKYWNAAAAYVASLHAKARNGSSEDAAACAMALSGFVRALMERLAEARYIAARGSDALPAQASDRSMFRTLLMVADSLGVNGEDIGPGSETRSLEGIGQALAPVRKAQQILSGGGTRTTAQIEGEIRPAINPLLYTIRMDGRLPADAGTLPEAQKAAIAVLIRLFDMFAERKAAPSPAVITGPAVEGIAAILSAA